MRQLVFHLLLAATVSCQHAPGPRPAREQVQLPLDAFAKCLQEAPSLSRAPFLVLAGSGPPGPAVQPFDCLGEALAAAGVKTRWPTRVVLVRVFGAGEHSPASGTRFSPTGVFTAEVGTLERPEAIQTVPAKFNQQGETGLVLLKCRVRSTGALEACRTIKGVAGQDPLTPVKQWKMRPGRFNGAPIDMDYVFQFRFVRR